MFHQLQLQIQQQIGRASTYRFTQQHFWPSKGEEAVQFVHGGRPRTRGVRASTHASKATNSGEGQ